MRSTNLDRKLHLVISKAVNTPKINLQGFDQICNNDYALVFSSSFDRDYSFDSYNKAVNELTDNAFSIEPFSLLATQTGSKPLFHCIARGNVESKPYNENEIKASMKAVGTKIEANMFMDQSDKIWQLEGEGDNKRLVRVTREDYHAVLEAKRSRSPVLSSMESIISYKTGDYVYFFNHETKAMDFGFSVERNNKDYVFARNSEKLVELHTPLQVVVAHEESGKNNPLYAKQKMVLAKDYSINGYLDYLKQLYGSENPYFQALEKAMRSYMAS